jgi:hypothetical protein
MGEVGSIQTTFRYQIIALNVATERVMETTKQLMLSAPADIQAAANGNRVVQTIAIVWGIFVVALSGLIPSTCLTFISRSASGKTERVGLLAEFLFPADCFLVQLSGHREGSQGRKGSCSDATPDAILITL